jgi:hypothetical protein
MPEQPPVDDILASIRARMTGEEPPPEPTEPPKAESETPVAPLPPLPEPSETALAAATRQLLEPMLKAWLDANLPELVERLAREEIGRLTGKG